MHQDFDSSKPKSNDILKKAFLKARSVVVDAENVSLILDVLYRNKVINKVDYEKLRDFVRRNDKRKCMEQLMHILHSRNDPEAFVQLRSALEKEKANKPIVKVIDAKYQELVQQSASLAPADSAKSCQRNSGSSLAQQRGIGEACSSTVAEPERNGILKEAFKNTHSRFVNCVNPSSIIDALFQHCVISVDDMRDLLQIQDNRHKCRHLLVLLNSTAHPDAFVKLRRALTSEPAYDHLVKEIDSQYQQLIEKTASCENLTTTFDNSRAAAAAETTTESATSGQQSSGFLIAQQHGFGNSWPRIVADMENLSKRLKHALSRGDDEIRSEVHPILFLTRCDGTITRDLLRTAFSFLDVVPWKAVFDFDNGENENSLYRYMDEDNGKIYTVTTVDEFGLRGSDNKDEKKIVEDTITNGSNAVWLFCNGYGTGKKEVYPLKEWKRNYSEGFDEAVRLIAQCIPQKRALIVFLCLSKDDEVMVFAADKFAVRFQSSWVAIAKNPETADSLKTQLCTTLDEDEVNKRCIVGMPWDHVNETVTKLFDDHVAVSCQLITSTGTPVDLPKRNSNAFADFEILGCYECENDDRVTNPDLVEERNNLEKDVEQRFYRGQQVVWWNFFFHSHVLKRNLFNELFHRVTSMLEQKVQSADQLVGQIHLYHQPAAGGTTIARQVLWELRALYRCAVLKRVSEITYDQLLELRAYKDKIHPKPVLLLLDNMPEETVSEFVAKLVDRAKKSSLSSEEQISIFFVLLICQSKAVPMKLVKTDFVLLAALTDQEQIWLEKKYQELEENFRKTHRDKTDWNNPQNFISFNVMKQNFDEGYMEEIVKKYTDGITKSPELQLLKYVSIISKFDSNRRSIPTASFDPLMGDGKWEANISAPLRVLLNETRSRTCGNGSMRIINSALSEYIYKELTGKEKQLEADVMMEFLDSEIFHFINSAVKNLLLIVRDLMKKRDRKVVDGEVIEGKFSPLIQVIVDDTNQNVPCAAKVLDRVFEITEDLFVAQQIARLYSHCRNWQEAIRYGKIISENENNSYLLDTLAQVYKERFHFNLKATKKQHGLLKASQAEEQLETAFQAIDIFQKCQKVSDTEKFFLVKNNSGQFGEIKTTLFLLEYLTHIEDLDTADVLQKFLIQRDFVPGNLRCWKPENTRRLKEIEKSVMKTITCLEDDYLQRQPNQSSYSEYALRKYYLDCKVLIKQKEDITSYFCTGSIEVPPGYSEQETSEYYRRLIRRRRGDNLLGLLDLKNKEVELLQIWNIVKKNIGTVYQTSFDLKVYLGVSLVNCVCVVRSAKKNAHSHQFSHDHVAKLSTELYEQPEVASGTDLEPFLYAVMFNWPRDGMAELPTLRAHRLPEVLLQWKEVFQRKYPRKDDEKKKEKTLFFLGKGVGMDAFAYEGELVGRGKNYASDNEFWRSDLVREKLVRLIGVLHRRHAHFSVVKMTLKQEGNEYEIEIPTAQQPVPDDKKYKKYVSFYLGFQWSGPKAFGVDYPEEEDCHDVSQSVKTDDLNMSDENEFPQLCKPTGLAVTNRQTPKNSTGGRGKRQQVRIVWNTMQQE